MGPHPPLALFALCLFLATLHTATAATIDPHHAQNLTLYHVHGANYSSVPHDMNTADINGDIYFSMRTKGLPLECGVWKNLSFWSWLDCSNAEVTATDLVVSKVRLQVDDRYGDYADCNINQETGLYSCDCENVQENCSAFTPLNDPGGNNCNRSNGCMWNRGRCDTYGCLNVTQKEECTQGYRKCAWHEKNASCGLPPGPPIVCNTSLVGFLNLSTVNWGRHPHHNEHESIVDYWHGNSLTKTNGEWYSTWKDGECRPNDASQMFCGWKVLAVVKRVTKQCSDSRINAIIETGDRTADWGARCFAKCDVVDRTNTSSKCWIGCFYNNVLGLNGSSQLLNRSEGIPVDVLKEAWQVPFKDVRDGGCPGV
jgi:hypothetical protein